jgi:ParB family transcriptional regulator, chromosome partitioning protein
MGKKRGLGRGLGALIPTAETAVASEEIRVIPVTAVQPNPHQPRTTFNNEQLAELAASITTHGLIQPLIVTEQADGYILIAGERRWRACQLAGLESVPAIVKEASPQAMLEMALIENIQRADLNPLEEAFAYQQLISEFGLTQEKVAQQVGKARSTVANLVRLVELPANIQQAVADGAISGTHARVLLQLPTPEAQTSAMRQIIKRNLTVRQTEEMVASLLATAKPEPKPRPTLPPELADLQNKFEGRLGTRVDIQKSGKGGRVVLHYYSDEELQAIYDAIVGKETDNG